MSGEAVGAGLARAGALVDVGRLDEAASIYAGLLHSAPEDVPTLCGMSRCLGRMGRTAEALDLAGRAAALAPENDWPHRLRSAHLLVLGRSSESLAAAEAAARLDPGGFAALLSLLEAQVARRDVRAATGTAEELQSRYPAQPESHNCVGRAAMLRKDWRAAEAAFADALRLAPNESVYQSNLALAVERLGRRKEAMNLFHQAVRTDPGNTNARRQLLHAIERRMAVAGVAGAGVALVSLRLASHLVDPWYWLLGGIGLAALFGLVVGLRWWRLRRLPESLRAFYRAERRQGREVRAAAVAGMGALGLAFAALLAGAAWVSRSPAVVFAMAVLMLLAVRYPGARLWHRHVVPVLRAQARGR